MALVSPLCVRPHPHPLRPHHAHHCGDSPCPTRSHLVQLVHALVLATAPIVSSVVGAPQIESLMCLLKWVDTLCHIHVRWPPLIRLLMLACRTLHEKL